MPDHIQIADDFYARVLQRIQSLMIVIGMAGLVTGWTFFGWRIAAGFTLGTAIAFLNFYWLKKVVVGIADLTLQSGAPASGRVVVRRFLFRYFLMAVVAFVILTVSRKSLYGLFAGLFLPLTAMLCEAVYEAYAVLVRRI